MLEVVNFSDILKKRCNIISLYTISFMLTLNIIHPVYIVSNRHTRNVLCIMKCHTIRIPNCYKIISDPFSALRPRNNNFPSIFHYYCTRIFQLENSITPHIHTYIRGENTLVEQFLSTQCCGW